MKRQDLKPWIVEAIKANNGKAAIFQICQYIWDNYHHRISADKKLLYTWQYEIRWAAHSLRNEGVIEIGQFKRGVWSLK